MRESIRLSGLQKQRRIRLLRARRGAPYCIRVITAVVHAGHGEERLGEDPAAGGRGKPAAGGRQIRIGGGGAIDGEEAEREGGG